MVTVLISLHNGNHTQHLRDQLATGDAMSLNRITKEMVGNVARMISEKPPSGFLKMCCRDMLLLHTVCALIFMGFIFRRFSIFADFAFLNSRMLAIFSCVSIDV